MKLASSIFLFLLRYTWADVYLPARKDGSLLLQDLGHWAYPLKNEMNVTMDIRPQFEIEFILRSPGNRWLQETDFDKNYPHEVRPQDLVRFGKTKVSYDVNGELAVSHYADGEETVFTTKKFTTGMETKHVRITQLKNAEGKYDFTIFWKTDSDETLHETITKQITHPFSKQNGQFERYEVIWRMRTCCKDHFKMSSLRIATHDCLPDNYFDGQRCRRYPIIRRKDEFAVKETHPIATFRLRKQFELEFEVNPIEHGYWRSIIRVGTYQISQTYSDNYPLIYIHEGVLEILRSMNGKKDGFTTQKLNVKRDIPVNEWTKIRVSQLLTEDGKYQFAVHVANELKITETETTPVELHNAMLWASDKWTTPLNGNIRHLRFVSHDCPYGHYLDEKSADCKKGQRGELDWASWKDCVKDWKDCDGNISKGGDVRSLLFDSQAKYPQNDVKDNKDGSLILQNMRSETVTSSRAAAANAQVGKAPIQIHSQFDIEFYVNGQDLGHVNKILSDNKISPTDEKPLKLMRMGKTLIAYGESQFIISHFVNGGMMTFKTKNLARLITEGHSLIKFRLTEFKNKDGKYIFTIFLEGDKDSGDSNEWPKGIFLKTAPEKQPKENETPYSTHMSEFERYALPSQLNWAILNNAPYYGYFFITNVKVSTHNCALGYFFDGKRCQRYSTFQQKDEIDVVPHKLLAVFPLFKQYEIEADVLFPEKTGGYFSILDVGSKCCYYGYNNPALVGYQSTYRVWANVNGLTSWPMWAGSLTSRFDQQELWPKMNKQEKWIHYRASQYLNQEGKYVTDWKMDGKLIVQVENTMPAEAQTGLMMTQSRGQPHGGAKIRNVRYVGHDCSEHQHFNEHAMQCFEYRHRFDEKDGWTTKMGRTKAKAFCEAKKLKLCHRYDLCSGTRIPKEKTDTWVVTESSTVQIGARKENGSPNFCQTHTTALKSPADWLDKDTSTDGNGYPFRNIMYCCGKKGEWSAWSEWTTCTKTCDKGTTKRSRECYNQKVNDFGCDGTNTEEEKPCNNFECPFKMCDVKSAENKVTCDEKKMTIKLAECFSDPKMTITLKDDKCKAVVSGTSVVLESGLEQCGMTMSSDDEHIVFENTLVLQTIEKTSDDKPGLIFTPKIKVRCKFPASSSTNMKLSVTVDNTESTTGVGVFEFVADSYTDETFQVTSDKPKVVGSQVYLGVKPKAPLPSDLSFYVTKCTVSNASTSYNILNERCPNTVVRGEADKGDSTTLFKIKYYAFQFHDTADKEVTSYDVACTVRLCLKGKCPAQPTCPGQSRR